MKVHLDSLVSAWSDCEEQSSDWTAETRPDAPAAATEPQPDEQGNYSSPSLEQLRCALCRFDEHSLDVAETMQELEVIDRDLQMRLGMLSESVERGWDEAADPLHQSIEAGFRRFELALKLAQLYVNTGLEPTRATALDTAQQATNELALAFARFLEHARACLHIDCPHCSRQNLRGESRCHGCSRPLPRPVVTMLSEGVAEPDEEAEETTPNYDRVASALEAWDAGEMTASEFGTELQAVLSRMERHALSVRRDLTDVRKLQGAEVDSYRRVLAATLEGLGNSSDGLKEMLGSLEDGDNFDLEAGWERFSQGTAQLLEAFSALQSLDLRRAA